MQDDHYPAPASVDDSTKGLRVLLGTILIILGLGVTIWILGLVYQIIMQGSEFALIRQLVPEGPETRFLNAPNATMQIPKEAFAFSAYLMTVLFLGVAGRIGVAFLNNGCNLMQLELKKLVGALRSELRRQGRSVSAE